MIFAAHNRFVVLHDDLVVLPSCEGTLSSRRRQSVHASLHWHTASPQFGISYGLSGQRRREAAKSFLYVMLEATLELLGAYS